MHCTPVYILIIKSWKEIEKGERNKSNSGCLFRELEKSWKKPIARTPLAFSEFVLDQITKVRI